MTSSNRSNHNIMNVREIIDTAFGNLNENTVNFKLLQTVLFLLANQLRVLERRVQIELPYEFVQSSSSLLITEVKIHAKKNKQKKTKPKVLKSKKKTGGSGPSSSDKTSTDKTSSSKSYEGKSSTDKSSTDKSSMDKASVDKSSTDKSSTDRTSTDKTSTYITSTDKTTTDKSSTDKSSKDKSTTDKYSTIKSSTEKSSTDKSSTDKSSTKKSSTDKLSTDKSSTYKTSGDKTSSYKAKKQLDKITEISSKTSTGSIPSKASDQIGRRDDERTLADNQSILEDLVDLTEKELRVIHQRADSHEQPDESPTPMASVDDIETQFEKLLIVERIPSGSKVNKSRSKDSLKISVVTQEEFQELVETVNELQERLAPIGTAKFPENAKLMAELRKTASLTDAMAALQLSARLEAAENALGHMIAIVTEVVSNSPGIELSAETKLILEAQEKSSKSEQKTDKMDYTVSQRKRTKKSRPQLNLPPLDLKLDLVTYKPESEAVEEDTPKPDTVVQYTKTEDIRFDCITYQDLDSAIKEICSEMLKNLQDIMSKNSTKTAQALKIVNYLENKMETALQVCPRMTELENVVASYADQINIMDTGLSSQMTNYQEQLTQMQHELEIGLDTMAEALANMGGDTAAVTELSNNFISLQLDFENMGYRQKELQETQFTLNTDLKGLWKQIEMLRDMKSDRDEVTDALRDKAGIADLNGLISLEQFNAVRGDLEKRILAAYEKFNNQEIVWQKAIDDLLRELSEKADYVQVLTLKDDITKHLNALNNRTQIIADIVGDPKSASVSKKLFRDTVCLCCSTPATMDLENSATVPALPKFGNEKKPHDVGANKEFIGDGDYRKCYQGLPIPHPRDPRSHHCQRYCGGSHTLLPTNLSKNPVYKKIDTDDKVYEKGDECEKIPCLPCNVTLTAEEIDTIHNRRS